MSVARHEAAALNTVNVVTAWHAVCWLEHESLRQTEARHHHERATQHSEGVHAAVAAAVLQIA